MARCVPFGRPGLVPEAALGSQLKLGLGVGECRGGELKPRPVTGEGRGAKVPQKRDSRRRRARRARSTWRCGSGGAICLGRLWIIGLAVMHNLDCLCEVGKFGLAFGRDAAL